MVCTTSRFTPWAIWMLHVPHPVRMASAFVRSSSLKSGAPIS